VGEDERERERRDDDDGGEEVTKVEVAARGRKTRKATTAWNQRRRTKGRGVEARRKGSEVKEVREKGTPTSYIPERSRQLLHILSRLNSGGEREGRLRLRKGRKAKEKEKVSELEVRIRPGKGVGSRIEWKADAWISGWKRKRYRRCRGWDRKRDGVGSEAGWAREEGKGEMRSNEVRRRPPPFLLDIQALSFDLAAAVSLTLSSLPVKIPNLSWSRAPSFVGSISPHLLSAPPTSLLSSLPSLFNATETAYSPTTNGSQFDQSAHERMTSRNPRARTNERKMTAANEKEEGKVRSRSASSFSLLFRKVRAHS